MTIAPAEHPPNGRDGNHSFAHIGPALVVLTQPRVAIEPSQSALDNPALGQTTKPCCCSPNEVCMKLKQGSTVFLKVVIVLIAIGLLAAMIRFPQTEGRAANLDLISIYADPLIIYGYIASVPFFVALYQAFKLLGYVDNNKVFSQLAVKAVKNIKYCAITISGLIILGVLYIRLFVNGDDPAGSTALGMFTTFASIVIATAAAIFERLLQNAVDIKSENDLTV